MKTQLNTFVAASLLIGLATVHAGSTLVNDRYFEKQWALANTGQTFEIDMDDIHPLTISGKPGMDIGWSPSLSDQMTREAMVALIDSGVKVDHEDLKGQILQNPSECKNGQMPVGPTGDPDKNGLDGDCMGWSFVTTPGTRLVTDDVGHGTHLAGILAASSNNQMGVSGLSNKIKILPLKVFDAADERGSKAPNRKPISERVADAIDYALSRQVDVINLSLGWPLEGHSARVQKSLDRAVAQGTIVVAGAGNDSHNAAIYPCAHPGVLCVGSIEADGSLSRFSNFGGHVDLTAPGGRILSLWPSGSGGLSQSASLVFGVKGYEIRSGTSQAAPFVSGAAAILKGIFPQASGPEIRARLLASGRKLLLTSSLNKRDSNRSAQGQLGLNSVRFLNLGAAAQLQNPTFVRPVFKKASQIVVQGQTFLLPVQLESFCSAPACAGTVEVLSHNPDVRILDPAQAFEFANGAQSRLLPIRARVVNPEAHALFDFAVVVRLNHGPQSQIITSTHQIQLVQDLTSLPAAKKYLIQGEIPDLKDLMTIPTYIDGQVDPEYYVTRKTDQGVYVDIFRFMGSALKLAGTLKIPQIAELTKEGGVVTSTGLLRLDIQGTKNLGYWTSGIIRDKNGEPEFVQFSYFNANFEPAFGANSHFKLQYEGVIPYSSALRFSRISVPGLGPVAAPTFIDFGVTPKKGRDPSPVAFDQDSNLNHLYLLAPRLDPKLGPIMETQLFDNFEFYKSVRQKLGLRTVDNVDLFYLEAPSTAGFEKGQIRAFAMTLRGAQQRYFLITTDGARLASHQYSLEPIEVGGLSLERHQFAPTLRSNSSGEALAPGTSATAIYSKQQARVVSVTGNQGQEALAFQSSRPFDHIFGLFKLFEINDEAVGFFETETEIVAKGRSQGREFVSRAPIFRFSYLPGAFFSQRFEPLFVGPNGNRPALLVDNSAIHSPTVNVWMLDSRNQLRSPLSYNVLVQKNCRNLKPNRVGGVTSIILLCQGEKENSLQVLPLR